MILEPFRLWLLTALAKFSLLSSIIWPIQRTILKPTSLDIFFVPFSTYATVQNANPK